MPQYRKLHTKVTQSFDFNEMPDDFTRVLWLLLPLGLDCEGRGIYVSSWIKAKLMPLREDVTSAKIMEAMEWFRQRRMIVVYSVDGRDYFYIPTFKDYQSGTEREAKSVLPAPPCDQCDVISTHDKVTTKSRQDQEQDENDSLPSVSVSASVNESVSDGVKQENVFSEYEKEIGAITPKISDDLQDVEKEYGAFLVCEAIREASRSNARSMKYVSGILRNWKREGRGPKQPNGKTALDPSQYNVILPDYLGGGQ